MLQKSENGTASFCWGHWCYEEEFWLASMDKNFHYQLFNFLFLFLRRHYSKAIRNQWGKIHALENRWSSWLSQQKDMTIAAQEQDLTRSQGVQGVQGSTPVITLDSYFSIHLLWGLAARREDLLRPNSSLWLFLAVSQCCALILNANQKKQMFLLPVSSQQHQMAVGKKKKNLSLGWMHSSFWSVLTIEMCYIFCILELFFFCLHLDSYCLADFPRAGNRHSIGDGRSGVMFYFHNC